jgi:hypothetical protein
VSEAVRKISAQPQQDVDELFLRMVFAALTSPPHERASKRSSIVSEA